MRNYITDLKNKLFSYDPSSFNDFDYATIGSLVLGLGDITWLVKDVAHNGFGAVYGSIALLFLIGNIMTVWGLHIHHKRAMYHRNRRRLERLAKEHAVRQELADEQNECL